MISDMIQVPSLDIVYSFKKWYEENTYGNLTQSNYSLVKGFFCHNHSKIIIDVCEDDYRINAPLFWQYIRQTACNNLNFQESLEAVFQELRLDSVKS